LFNFPSQRARKKCFIVKKEQEKSVCVWFVWLCGVGISWIYAKYTEKLLFLCFIEQCICTTMLALLYKVLRACLDFGPTKITCQKLTLHTPLCVFFFALLLHWEKGNMSWNKYDFVAFSFLWIQRENKLGLNALLVPLFW
jgi:hypothetical protein